MIQHILDDKFMQSQQLTTLATSLPLRQHHVLHLVQRSIPVACHDSRTEHLTIHRIDTNATFKLQSLKRSVVVCINPLLTVFLEELKNQPNNVSSFDFHRHFYSRVMAMTNFDYS